jgi:hypothetical protein
MSLVISGAVGEVLVLTLNGKHLNDTYGCGSAALPKEVFDARLDGATGID